MMNNKQLKFSNMLTLRTYTLANNKTQVYASCDNLTGVGTAKTLNEALKKAVGNLLNKLYIARELNK